MVKCIVPVRLFGPEAGEYERNAVYPNDELAVNHPDNFQAVPADDPGQAPVKKPKK